MRFGGLPQKNSLGPFKDGAGLRDIQRDIGIQRVSAKYLMLGFLAHSC